MKANILTTVVLLFLLTGSLFSQQASGDSLRNSDRGAYLIDDTKLGTINGSQSFSIATRLTILLRKGTNMRTGAVDKGLVFTNSLSEPDNAAPFFCFIEQDEIDDAMHALQFINDSLLTRTPDHDVEYSYNFPLSPEQLFVYYNIYFDRRAKWSIVFDFDRFVNDTNWVTIENKDCSTLIDFFKAAKEKLKTY